jgi:hypothetical protein
LKSKGGFTDTQTEARLVQRITPLFSMTASQQLTPSVSVTSMMQNATRRSDHGREEPATGQQQEKAWM